MTNQTRKTTFSKINNFSESTDESSKNLWSYSEIIEKTEFHVKNFLEKEIVFCHRAKEEGWLGSEWNAKDYRGLLGYMRTGFSIQLQVLLKFDNVLPIYQAEFVTFFRSDFFTNTVLEKGFIAPIYKKEHFELIKKYRL